MATPARSDPPRPASARINSCQAAFHVTSPTGPLSSPETLLAALRCEILPALSDVLDAPEWAGITIEAEHIEIDLGHWPDDPVWSDVRYVLATKLRYALADYLPPTPAASGVRKDAPVRLAGEDTPARSAQTEQDTHRSRAHREPRDADQAGQTAAPHARSDAATHPTIMSQQQIMQRVEAFVQWAQAATDNRTLSRIMARLDQRSDERRALAAVLYAQSAPRVLSEQTVAQAFNGEFGALVSQALALLEARGQHTATPSRSGANHEGVDNPDASPPPTFLVGDAQTMAQTGLQQGLSSDLSATLNGSDAFSVHVSRAKDSLFKKMMQAGVPENEAHAGSFVLLERLMPFLEGVFTAGDAAPILSAPPFAKGSQTPGTPPQTAANDGLAQTPDADTAAKTQSAASTLKADNTGASVDNHRTSQSAQKHLDENPQDKHPEATASPPARPVAPAKPDPGDPHSSSERDAAALGSSNAGSDRDIANFSGVSDQTYLRDLQDLAHHLGRGQGISPGGFCIQKLTENPRLVITTAADLGYLSSLVRLLGETGPDKHLLLAQTPLDAQQIKALHTAEPALFTKTVARLTAAQAFDLAQKLLPSGAALLIERLNMLRQTAKSPHLAMQQAVIALLQGDLLDFEQLADATQPPTATPSSDPQGEETVTTHDTFQNRLQPDQAVEKPVATRDVATAQAHDSLAETVMRLAGFHRREIERISGPAAQTRPPQSDENLPAQQSRTGSARADAPKPSGKSEGHVPTPDASSHRPNEAELFAKASALIKALAGPEQAHFRDAADLLLRAWPTAQPGGDAALGLAALRAELTLLTSTEDGRVTLGAYIEAVVQEIEPDETARQSALRVLAARLSIPIGTVDAPLRHRTHAAVQSLLDQQTPQVPQAEPKPPPDQEPPSAMDSETLLGTEVAGLALLNPYITLLFERLKIERDGKTLRDDACPTALAALHYLGGTAPGPAVDPFHRVLLGLDPATRLPPPPEPDKEAQTLMDGLLRAVVDRWGKLGKTSPDGLRETFLRRTGTLRFDETGAHLRVTPGPFDMLLDGLPWSIERVVLPWMPVPCHVIWREDHDA